MRAHCFKDQVAWSPHPALFTIESVPDFKPTQYPVPELLGLRWDFVIYTGVWHSTFFNPM